MGRQSMFGGLVSLALFAVPLMIEQTDASAHQSLRNPSYQGDNISAVHTRDLQEEGMCPDGIEGVLSASGNVCCSPSCSMCGGPMCGMFGGEPSDCCETNIMDGGGSCAETNSAPCIVPAPTTTAPNAPPTEGTCSNGIAGVESSGGSVCCAASCGMCGGPGCSSNPGPASDCCTSDIELEGESCAVTNAAPCIIEGETVDSPTPEEPTATDAPVDETTGTCSNGIAGLESSSGTVCCAATCSMCGGAGCSSNPGPASDCCMSVIQEGGEMCAETNTAPCIIEGETADPPTPAEPTATDAPVDEPTATDAPVDETTGMCSNGIAGLESSGGSVCCAATCGMCGGPGCSSNPGPASDCCTSEIEQEGESCAVTNAAPCIIEGETADPPTPAEPTATEVPVDEPTATDAPIDETTDTCSNGIAGVESASGSVCCPSSCSMCGGSGCANPGPASDCCMSVIEEGGEMCAETNTAPCIIEGETVDSPTPAEPTATDAPVDETTGTCSNGIAGLESSGGTVCCAATCSMCGGAGCSTPGPASDCCTSEIELEGVLCSDTNTAPCVI